MSDQRVEQAWETPTHEEIVHLTAAHVQAMETMDIDEVWNQAGMKHILIKTVGRKSGNVHKIALPTWNDPDGHRIVVASYAGHEKHPAWLLNLRDEKNALVPCKVQGGQFLSRPEELQGEERQRIWDLLTADRAWYNDYQARTERQIPLVRLPESEPLDTWD